MKERIETIKIRIKTHIKEHKEAYITGGVCLGVAGITTLIMRDDNDVLLRGTSIDDNAHLLGASTVLKPTYWAHGSSFSDSDVTDSFNVYDSFNNVVNVLERDGRGHPGYMIRCVEENLTYPSQLKASLAHGIHPNRMSDHLNSRLDHVDGKHFERVQLAA